MKSHPINSHLNPFHPVPSHPVFSRGLANSGRERQIAYVVIGVGEGARDNSNFSPTAIRDASPRVLEQLPFWDDY